MKDKSFIQNKILEISQRLEQPNHTEKLADRKLLVEYRKLLKFLDLEEEKAYSICAIPMADSWWVGYWKAIDVVLQEITPREPVKF